MDFIDKFRTKKNIILGLTFIFFVNIVAFPFFPLLIIGRTIPIESILDLQFGFTVEQSQLILNNLQKDGRLAYKFSTAFIDIPYAIVYGVLYSLIISIFIEINNLNKYKIFTITPLIISFFDLIENIGILFLLSNFPLIDNNLNLITSLANQFKWIFAIVTGSIFIFLIMFFIKEKLKPSIK